MRRPDYHSTHCHSALYRAAFSAVRPEPPQGARLLWPTFPGPAARFSLLERSGLFWESSLPGHWLLLCPELCLIHLLSQLLSPSGFYPSRDDTYLCNVLAIQQISLAFALSVWSLLLGFITRRVTVRLTGLLRCRGDCHECFLH